MAMRHRLALARLATAHTLARVPSALACACARTVDSPPDTPRSTHSRAQACAGNTWSTAPGSASVRPVPGCACSHQVQVSPAWLCPGMNRPRPLATRSSVSHRPSWIGRIVRAVRLTHVPHECEHIPSRSNTRSSANSLAESVARFVEGRPLSHSVGICRSSPIGVTVSSPLMSSPSPMSGWSPSELAFVVIRSHSLFGHARVSDFAHDFHRVLLAFVVCQPWIH